MVTSNRRYTIGIIAEPGLARSNLNRANFEDKGYILHTDEPAFGSQFLTKRIAC